MAAGGYQGALLALAHAASAAGVYVPVLHRISLSSYVYILSLLVCTRLASRRYYSAKALDSSTTNAVGVSYSEAFT
jgi:hypothetical protein